MKKNILFVAVLLIIAAAALLILTLYGAAPKSKEAKNPTEPSHSAASGVANNQASVASSSLPTTTDQTQVSANPNSQSLTGAAVVAVKNPNPANTSAETIQKNSAAAPPNNVSATPQTTVRQTSLMGTVLSVDNDKFTLLSAGQTIVVALDPNALMYTRKSAARIAAQIPQSNIQPGHQIRVVTNDEIAGTTIKPLIVEDFSLPALGD